MSGPSATMQAETMLYLAKTAVEVRGPVGALKWASNIMIDETKSYTAAVKAQQDKGSKVIEMTEDMVNLYNPVVWATALVAAVLIEIGDIPLTGDNQPGESPGRAKFN